MKIRYLLLFVVCINSFFASATTLSLYEAMIQKKVDCTFRGNGSSTHYLEPVLMEISNLSAEPLTVMINSGDEFIPSDTNQQNLVVTKNEMVILKSKEIKTLKLHGMCTEQSDRSGNSESIYSYQPAKNEPLKKLASFINTKNYQSSAAQYAVWSLVNDEDINSIFSSDSTEEKELKQFVANLTGKTFAVKSKDYRYNYYAPPKERTGGNFEYSFSQPQNIQIAMFDKNGILVRELFNQKKVPSGAHRLKFEFDSSVYTDDVYYFKLIVENEVLVSRKWDAQAMRDSFKNKFENRE